MTRDELIEIGRRIVKAEEREDEVNKLMELFDKNVTGPNGSNLFFWPENYDFRSDNVSEYNPTVEEIVDKCLSYKAFEL